MLLGGVPASVRLKHKISMNFKMTPKRSGKPLQPDFQIPFNGTREEAWRRAMALAQGLETIFRGESFSIRIDRTDKPAQGYEVDSIGKTV